MDHQQFEALTRAITAGEGSRRAVVRLLAGAAALGFALGGLTVVDAKKRKKNKTKKKKKQKPLPPPLFNAFGCVNVGGNCQGNSALCCSGICQGEQPRKGKPDTSICVAHNTGGCTPERNACVTGNETSICNPDAVCTLTTGGAGFCASRLNASRAQNCRICRTDADCVAQGFPPGSACVILTGGQCVGESDCANVNGSSGTACLAAGAST
jgi:hypothetical protein